MPKRPNILLIVGGINEMSAQYDSAFLDSLSSALHIEERVICESEPCLRRMFTEADALIYLDGFPLSYQEVSSIADSVWNAPPVIGIDKMGDEIRIWSEAYSTEWINRSELADYVQDAVKNAISYRHKGKTWTTVVYAFLFLLALLIVCPVVHAKKIFNKDQQPTVEETINDDSSGFSTR